MQQPPTDSKPSSAQVEKPEVIFIGDNPDDLYDNYNTAPGLVVGETGNPNLSEIAEENFEKVSEHRHENRLRPPSSS